MAELKPFELGIAILTDGLVLLTLMGLIVRHQVASCRAFTLYLGMVLATDSLMLVDSFDTRAFWLLKELLLFALKFAIALELMSRAFDRFPGARATAHGVMRLVLGLTLVIVIWVAAGWQGDATGLEQRDVAVRIIGEFHPRLVTATTCLFVAIAAMILWYRLPLEALPKAILIGFVPYLIFFYLVLQLRMANLWPQGGWLANLDSGAYPLLLAYWARTAWQPVREIMPRVASPVPVIQGSAG